MAFFVDNDEQCYHEQEQQVKHSCFQVGVDYRVRGGGHHDDHVGDDRVDHLVDRISAAGACQCYLIYNELILFEYILLIYI